MAMLSLPPPGPTGDLSWRGASTAQSMAVSFTPPQDAVTVSHSDMPPRLSELAPKSRFKRPMIVAAIALGAVGAIVGGTKVMSSGETRGTTSAARAVDVMPTGQAEGPERAPPPEAPNTAATPSSQATTDEPPARADSEDDGKAASEDAGKAASETPGEEQAGRSLPQKERKKRAPSSARPRPKKKAAAAVDDLKAPY
jgi:hypothetical protein